MQEKYESTVITSHLNLATLHVQPYTLKGKNESNSNWVNFNLFPKTKRIFSSWVDFTRLNDLIIYSNLSYLSKFKPQKNHNYQKCAKGSFNLSLSNIQSDLRA